MDDSKTLDFNDLMDVGDEYPGFEIAKFTPVGETATNDDGVLRTPTHEKVDDDYEVGENVQQSEETGSSIDNDHNSKVEENSKDDSVNTDATNNDENSNPGEKDDESSTNMNGETYKDANDVNNDNTGDAADEENSEGEPVKKKKKMYLKPPRPKIQLWGGNKQSTNNTENEIQDDNEDKGSSSNTTAEVESENVVENGEEEVMMIDDDDDKGKPEEIEINDDDDVKAVNNEKPEEEDPHQQSFLSFLNLKPGSSKPKDSQADKEKSQKAEFYSRKRLRTRKKVSYYEDVSPDDDDEYNVDDDEAEDINDHVMDDNRNRNNRPRSRTNSKSPITSPGVTAASYAASLQKLLPGVDLSCLNKAPVQKPLTPVQKPLTARIGPKSFMNNLITNPQPQPQPVARPGNMKGLFECGLCGTFFKTASQFITHQETMHSKERKTGRSGLETFRCEICGFVLTNCYAYQEHKRMKHNKSGSSIVLNCSKCKVARFNSVSELQKHQMMCGTPFCSTCNKKFDTWVDVAEHRRNTHNNVGQPTRQWLTCVNRSCDFKCLTNIEMKSHVQQKHMLNELFTCNAPKCSQVFKTRDELTEHKKEAHASEFIVQYQCTECRNCFSSKTLLAEHQYLHTLEKLKKCDLCSRHFTNIIELRKHKDVHAVKGTIRCQACLRWCNDKLELVNHVCSQKRRTSGIRLYFCDVCHKDFRSDEKMFIHRKEHKNFFQCPSCFYDCSSESEYFQHRQVHGKFTCVECCEELDEKNVEPHQKAHQYYVKTENIENDGKNEKAMFLCPNLVNVIKA
ncbi:hypothetical protein ACF0H5_020914 [Mactra antiquata]